jgi:hypothetical protein
MGSHPILTFNYILPKWRRFMEREGGFTCPLFAGSSSWKTPPLTNTA